MILASNSQRRQEILKDAGFKFKVIASDVEEISDKNKPIFAFDNTSHDSSGRSRIFSSIEPEKMVEAIRKFLGVELSGK